jgi:hypothetical protein
VVTARYLTVTLVVTVRYLTVTPAMTARYLTVTARVAARYLRGHWAGSAREISSGSNRGTARHITIAAWGDREMSHDSHGW